MLCAISVAGSTTAPRAAPRATVLFASSSSFSRAAAAAAPVPVSATSAVLPNRDMIARLPSVAKKPADSTTDCAVAAAAARARFTSTGSPRSCWARACSCRFSAYACGNATTAGPASVPRSVPPGMGSAAPVLAPSAAAVVIAAMFVDCPAKARGTSLATALAAAGRAPDSLAVRINASSDGPSPAAARASSSRRSPSSAARFGSPATDSYNVRPAETARLAPSAASPRMVDCLPSPETPSMRLTVRWITSGLVPSGNSRTRPSGSSASIAIYALRYWIGLPLASNRSRVVPGRDVSVASGAGIPSVLRSSCSTLMRSRVIRACSANNGAR